VLTAVVMAAVLPGTGRAAYGAASPGPAGTRTRLLTWVNGQVIRANGAIGNQTQGNGPGISTGARHGEKRHADLVNINSWRSA
jgi:hypothetical protein